jgi:hypothetical protein
MASGILIYTGLVDLLSTDLFGAHMRSQSIPFQAGCLAAVVLGAIAMVRSSDKCKGFPSLGRVACACGA